MNAKIILTLLLIGLTIFIGIVLHRTGKPYNTFYFSVHKLATIGFVVLLFFVIKQFKTEFGLQKGIIVSIVLSSITLLGLLISGGFLSQDKAIPWMTFLHKIATILFSISIIVLFYFIFKI